MPEDARYEPLDARSALQLMAPHTWVAAIAPVLVGTALSWGLGTLAGEGIGSILCIVVLMLATSVVMQSAVNTFNDYADFVKGSDTADNVVDTTDASIIYNRLDPAQVRTFAIALMALAAILGLTLVLYTASWWLLALGLVGAAAIVLYSFGPTPISYLPLGELVSGVVMGGIIAVATFTALSGAFVPMMFVSALPVIIGVGVIMQVNNTCDIEKDIEAGRRTLPIALGRRLSIRAIVALSVVSLAIVALVVALHFPAGLIAFALFLIPLWRNLTRLGRDAYDTQSRSNVMLASVRQLALTSALYVSAIVIGVLIDAF